MNNPIRTAAVTLALVLAALQPLSLRAQATDNTNSAIIKSEFIVEAPPFPTSHASTIVETRDGLVAAWFGGSHERAADVSIWLSRNDGHNWGPAEEVANGIDEKHARRDPCWNPVLFVRRNGDLMLFYKVGPSPSSWWGMYKVSENNGRTWSEPQKLPNGIIGPVRNKPLELKDGTILCGSSIESEGWRVHMERFPDANGHWQRLRDLNSAMEYSAIQPTILPWPDGRLQILCRTKQGKITDCWSGDNGMTWGRMMGTVLPNPNSAIDGVVLRDGPALLVYNHSTEDRNRLNVALSPDGRAWQAALVLEDSPGEYSYPAVIQTSDGLVHVTYSWKRERIKHVVFDPTKLSPKDMPDGRWP